MAVRGKTGWEVSKKSDPEDSVLYQTFCFFFGVRLCATDLIHALSRSYARLLPSLLVWGSLAPSLLSSSTLPSAPIQKQARRAVYHHHHHHQHQQSYWSCTRETQAASPSWGSDHQPIKPQVWEKYVHRAKLEISREIPSSRINVLVEYNLLVWFEVELNFCASVFCMCLYTSTLQLVTSLWYSWRRTFMC